MLQNYHSLTVNLVLGAGRTGTISLLATVGSYVQNASFVLDLKIVLRTCRWAVYHARNNLDPTLTLVLPKWLLQNRCAL